MRKLPQIDNNDMLSGSDINVLSENEMFHIRGGGEPIKPNSRPREQLDWEGEARTAGIVQSTEESSLLDYLKSWLKNLR